MSKPDTPDAYFATIPGDMQRLAKAVRHCIRERAPHLTEALAWGFPCYSGHERVFSVIAHKAHVNLQLWNGNRLAGLDDRIEGSGKQLRHVKLKGLADLDTGFEAIIDAAVSLDQSAPERVR